MALSPGKTTTLASGLIIKEYLLTAHNPNKITMPAKRTQPLIGVTLHNTADLDNVHDDSEQYTRATINGNMSDTRVHYYVDDVCAWRNLSDDYEGWHSATGRGQGNGNTISIECIMRNQTDKESLAGMENAAKLIAWIFGQYGWTCEKNLFTHNYWTNYKATGALSADLDKQSLAICDNKTANPNGKYCPAYILPQWEKFKGLVKKYMGGAMPTAEVYRVRESWENSASQKGAFESLELAKGVANNSGYNVYDSAGKLVYSPKLAPEVDRLKAEIMKLKQENEAKQADHNALITGLKELVTKFAN
jgi:hypothetical protein